MSLASAGPFNASVKGGDPAKGRQGRRQTWRSLTNPDTGIRTGPNTHGNQFQFLHVTTSPVQVSAIKPVFATPPPDFHLLREDNLLPIDHPHRATLGGGINPNTRTLRYFPVVCSFSSANHNE